MSKKQLRRSYVVSDGTLKQMGDDLVNLMERDSTEFATRNIGADDRDALTALLEDFGSNVSDDTEELGLQQAATEQRNELAEKLRVSIRSIRGIVEARYGLGGTYRRFGFGVLDKFTDDGLYRLARRIVRLGTELLPELSIRGLTMAMLNDLAVQAQAFDEAIEKVHDEAADRYLATEARIIKGNAIWTMMCDFAAIGKSLFVDTDHARYRHYVLTD
jgi:hypothetical protein